MAKKDSSKNTLFPISNNNGNRKVKKEYKEMNPTDIVRFGKDFVFEFFYEGDTAIEVPINALRIIFNIVSTLRNEQFQNRDSYQLSLFDEEFKTEHNTFGSFKIRNSLISRDSNDVKKAYEFLVQFKMGWYKSENQEGKIIQSYGGLISAPSYQERGYTSFLINSYWLEKLTFIPEYNNTLYKIVYKCNNKQVLFWFWLSTVPAEGTKIKLSTLNKKFRLNYGTAKDICKGFLKPIRDKFNKYSHTSFNYSITGNLIYIKPYAVNNSLQEEELKAETVQKIKANYSLRYFKNRHQLNEKQLAYMDYIFKNVAQSKLIIIDAYKLLVSEHRAKKVKVTELVGDDFLHRLQELVIEVYRKTSTGKKIPNGYPRII